MKSNNPRTHPVVWLRRSTQTVFLLLFLYLFLQTVYHPINQAGEAVTFFFNIDPLVLVAVYLAAHTVATALLLSLATLAVTLVFGRWFCGWVCPFGTLHNLFSSGRGGPLKTKIQTGGYSNWQKSKYLLLVVVLVIALLGMNLVGWLDPLSFFYRSLATAVFPAINAGIQMLFGWLYSVNPGAGKLRMTAVSEPVYAVLRKYFLAVEQPHYAGGMLVGALFGFAVALNFYRARFWCRYLCPLGALLGIVGKNPLVRLKKNPETCNNCRLCLAECQGGANLQTLEEWKPAECFYCWNCQSKCPNHAISLVCEVPREERKP
jgi:polyferredoxin